MDFNIFDAKFIPVKTVCSSFYLNRNDQNSLSITVINLSVENFMRVGKDLRS